MKRRLHEPRRSIRGGNEGRRTRNGMSFMTVLATLLLSTLMMNAIDDDVFGRKSMNAVDARLVASELEILIEFFNSTGGTSWYQNFGWLDANTLSDPCNVTTAWFGLTCTAGTNIYTISLTSNNLVGTIPQSIGNLTHIIGLDLSNNSLSGTIPPSMGNFGELTYIYLWGNLLSGALPPSLFNLQQITKVMFQNNSLSGSLPDVSNFTQLTFLDLSTNKFGGALPPSLWNLIEIDHLYLDHNSFSGPIPSNVNSLTKLEYLYLSNNGLRGSVPPEIWTMSSLIQLSLGTNKLSGTLPDLSALSRLQLLDLDNTEMSGTLPDSLWNLYPLQNINLAGAAFSGTISSAISNLSNLTSISILSLESASAKDKFSGSLPSTLWEMPQLMFLIFDFNNFNGTLPDDISNLNQLQKFHIQGNQFTGTIPVGLWRMTTLTDLDIQSNQFSGTIPSDIAALSNITNLMIGDNYFSGYLPEWFNQTLPGFQPKTTLIGNMWLCPIPSVTAKWGATCKNTSISSLSSSIASIEGGLILQINGSTIPYGVDSNLKCQFSNENMTVRVSLSSSVTFPVHGSQSLTCTVPAFQLGPANISLLFDENPITSPSPVHSILFYTTPSIYYVSPTLGRQQGSTVLTIVGANFTDTLSQKCLIGNETVTASYVNETTIVCTTLPHFPANVTLTVSNDGKTYSSSYVEYEFYPDCDVHDCNNNGICVVTGLYAECHCNENFTGPSCVECDPGFYGASCAPCPLCVNGTCDQGYNATGKCECITWYSGHLCTVNYGHVLLYTLAPALGLFFFGALVFYWRKRRANVLGPARTSEEKQLLLSDSPSLNSPAFAGSPHVASSSTSSNVPPSSDGYGATSQRFYSPSVGDPGIPNPGPLPPPV